MGENMWVGVVSRLLRLWTRLSPSEQLSMLRMELEGLSCPGLEIGEKAGSGGAAAVGTDSWVGTCSWLGTCSDSCRGVWLTSISWVELAVSVGVLVVLVGVLVVGASGVQGGPLSPSPLLDVDGSCCDPEVAPPLSCPPVPETSPPVPLSRCCPSPDGWTGWEISATGGCGL